MNAVGIDVSKGKSTVTIRRPGDVVVMPPRDIPHTQSEINSLIAQIRNLDGETKVCMERRQPEMGGLCLYLLACGLCALQVSGCLYGALPELA